MQLEETLEKIKRGTVEIIPEHELIEKLKTGKKLKIKAGFDPTAPDLHLGHAVLLRKMRQFQDLGHEVNFLLGDFTAMIGDPTGKSETRKRLNREEVIENSKTYESQVYKILDPQKVKIVFNSSWCSPMKFEDVLVLSSKYNVARLLERDDFSKRFKSGNPISLIEFLYPLVQGYDSVVMESDIELGGNDQKFNLLVGRELQRDYGKTPQVVITVPLLVGLDGVKKMSKSLGNYIGFSEEPIEMYGKLMSISDTLMWEYYNLLTDIPMKEVDSLKTSVLKNEVHPKEVKSNLGSHIIRQFHPADKTNEAIEEWHRIHNPKNRAVPTEMETHTLDPATFQDASPMLLGTLQKIGFFSSVSEGKRLVQNGGLYVNETKITDEKFQLEKNREYIVRQGKKGKYIKLIT